MSSDKLLKRGPYRGPALGLQLIDVPRPSMEEHRRLSNDPTLKDYWLVLRRRKRTVILFAATVFMLVGVASFLMTPLYEATGRISVARENSNLLSSKEGADTISGDNAEYNMYLDAQIRILTSDTLVLQVAKDLHSLDTELQTDTTRNANTELANKQEASVILRALNRLDVSRVPRTPIIEIKYSDADPRTAAAFVNGIVRAYVEQNFRTRYDSTKQVSTWLADQLQELKADVERSQQKQVDYQRQKGILGIDEKQNIVTAKLDELNRELTAAEADRLQKQAIYENTISNDADLSPGTAENQVIQHLKQRQSEIKSQYAQATTELGHAHPKVLELQNELNLIDSVLTAEINKVAERSRMAYQIALKREKMLHAALEAQKQEANQLNESAIQYNILRHDLQSNQQLYDGLLQKLKEAGVSAGLKSTNVRVVDYARVPIRPSKPNILRNLAIGLLLGCLGGGALAFVLEKLDDRLRTPDQIESISALPPIAVIPDIGSEGKRQLKGSRLKHFAGSTNGHAEKAELITYSRPNSEYAECYRALRTSLLLSSSTDQPKVILITSALPYEGKTTISVNCAMVLAQKKKRVLLIDADLRAPKIHQVLKVSSRSGLSTLLSGSAEVRPVDVIVQSAQLSTLFVLPAGPIPDQPAELLDSDRMKRFLAEWRHQFDHIVFDTAPLLLATDSTILSMQADSVLLTVRSGQTPKEALVRARDLLLGVGANLIGVVVNAVDLREPGLNNYGYYGYSAYTRK